MRDVAYLFAQESCRIFGPGQIADPGIQEKAK